MITMERAEGAVAIDICEAEAVLSSVQRKLNAVRAVDNFTIFRVPAYFRQGNNMHLYKPLMVAIGPYGRREEPSLRVMEEHKWRYVQDFLSRCSTTIEQCIDLIQEVEPWARRCYFERVELSTEKFVEMLLLDGCFIVEFLIKLNGWDNDGFLAMEWSLPHVIGDLLLFENQIPFFVLEKLYELHTFKINGTAATTVQEPEISFLRELLVNFLTITTIEIPGGRVERNKHLIMLDKDTVFNHLLHFCYHLNVAKPQLEPTGCTNCGTILKWLNPSRVFTFLLSYVRSMTGTSNKKRFSGTIPSATELLEAGVKIKKKKKNQNQNHLSSFLDVTFCPRDGVLEIPFLVVDYSTVPLFSNLMAFEQCGGCKLEEAYMTSYAAFMDCLIDTPGDVAILLKRGILENKLASDKELADFFNGLSNWAILDCSNHYLAELFWEVEEYCDSGWPKLRMTLVRDYFGSRWSFLSFLGAVAALLFTIIQTFFTVYPKK